MSCSSLYVIDKSTYGKESEQYGNSWIFSPTIWSVLSQKYMADDIATPYGFRKSMIGFGGDELFRKLNDLMNASDNTTDRICWELSHQQGFYTKDKKLVSDSIRKFLVDNAEVTLNDEGRKMSKDHGDRFHQIAEDIENIDEILYPYFVFKNTSVDDGVENLFMRYDENDEDYVECTLKEQTEFKLEFVIIADGLVKEFRTHDELVL